MAVATAFEIANDDNSYCFSHRLKSVPSTIVIVFEMPLHSTCGPQYSIKISRFLISTTYALLRQPSS